MVLANLVAKGEQALLKALPVDLYTPVLPFAFNSNKCFNISHLIEN